MPKVDTILMIMHAFFHTKSHSLFFLTIRYFSRKFSLRQKQNKFIFQIIEKFSVSVQRSSFIDSMGLVAGLIYISENRPIRISLVHFMMRSEVSYTTIGLCFVPKLTHTHSSKCIEKKLDLKEKLSSFVTYFVFRYETKARISRYHNKNVFNEFNVFFQRWYITILIVKTTKTEYY